MGILLLNLIITAALYCGPILFLRYVVFQKKINKNRALVYVIVSTIVVFIGIQIFTDYMYGTASYNGAPAGLWGIIGYFILADTKKREDVEDISADQEQPKTPSPAQIPEKKSETTTKDIPTENKQQKAVPEVLPPEKKTSRLSLEKKCDILLVYSIVTTVLAIIFLGLSIKFYDDYKLATTPHYRVHIDGKLHKIIGYYTRSGDLIPFDSKD